MNKRIKNLAKKISFLYRPYKSVKVGLISKKRNRNLFRNGYALLGEVSSAFKGSGLLVFCDYGTLLGFVRENGFISNDLDIDMGIIDSKNFSWEKVDGILGRIGMVIDHQFILDDGKITEKTYSKNGVSIDFFLHEKKRKGLVTYVYNAGENEDWEKCTVIEGTSPNIGKVYYEEKRGILVPLITNYDNYLTSVYGEWRTPDPNFHSEKLPMDGRSGRREIFRNGHKQ